MKHGTGLSTVVVNEIRQERRRQRIKWGPQTHSDLYWLAILSEEVGEAAKAALEEESGDLRAELVQVAAVACAWLDQLRTGKAV